MFAQFAPEEVVQSMEVELPADQWKSIELETFSFNAFSVKADNLNQLDGLLLISNGDTISVGKNAHPETDELNIADLIFFNELKSSISIFSKFGGKFKLFFIDSSRPPSFIANRMNENINANDSCEEPFMITQEEWRTGLPLPKPGRSFTSVRQIIIHHSAGSNSSKDFVEVVRGIYLYHTEVNEWADIGYNYLIAPNGIIFKGRDPEGGAQDEVLGAHYCGKNSGTMGICLLGTFTNQMPTSESLTALVDLVSWKASKDGINPIGKSVDSGGILIDNISGHRDGCSTLCPGELLYEKLSLLRMETMLKLESCKQPNLSYSVYPNPVEGSKFTVRINTNQPAIIKLVDSKGLEVLEERLYTENPEIEIETSPLQSGLYYLMIKTNLKTLQEKLVITN
jgi:hypothetical protein